MQQPERVFAEVYRVLKPGGVFILTFSNRMFYDKVRCSACYRVDVFSLVPAAAFVSRTACKCEQQHLNACSSDGIHES